MQPEKFLISLIFCLSITQIFSKSTPKPIVIPFDLINKLVVVKATVNGVKGHFIVDTGSGPLILNARYFSGRRNNNSVVLNFKAERAAIGDLPVRFSWDGVTAFSFNAIVTNLESVEKILKVKLLGYIGNEIFNDQELVFDYLNKEITLFQLDRRGRRVGQPSMHKNATHTFHLVKNRHLLYLSAKLGGHKLKLALDSGTSLNLLHKGLLKKLRNHFWPESPIQLAGIGGKPVQAPSGTINDLKLQTLELSAMRTCFTDIDQLNRSLSKKLDGLLGYEFFKRYKLSINYKKRELYIWSPKKIGTQIAGLVSPCRSGE